MSINCRQNESGYSLVELLVSTAVSVTLMGAMYSVLFQSQATTEAQQDQAALRPASAGCHRPVGRRAASNGLRSGQRPGATHRCRRHEHRSGRRYRQWQHRRALRCRRRNVRRRWSRARQLPTSGSQPIALCRLLGRRCVGQRIHRNLVVATDLQAARPLFRYFDEDGIELLPGIGTLNPTNRDRVRVVQIDLQFRDTDDQALGMEYVGFDLKTAVRLRNAF